MKITFKTDIGYSRAENQDNYRAGWENKNQIWAVMCDGMGGANGGALASRIACDTVEECLNNSLYNGIGGEETEKLMREALKKVNTKIFNCAKQDITLSGMGTTAVLAVLNGYKLYLAHAGDSRAYLYSKKNNTVTQLTRDHSMVQELVEKGSITEEEAYTHPRKNLITRALGVAPEISVEFGSSDVEKGDLVFLCTDGLSNYITPQGFCDILSVTPFYQTAAVMVDTALKAGGNDNVSVLVIMADTDTEDN